MFQITEIVDLWFLRHDSEQALNNLSKSILGFMCIAKSSSFILLHKQWRSVIYFISDTEKKQLLQEDRVIHDIMKKYTKYSRPLTYLYWLLAFSTALALFISPVAKYFSSSEYRDLIKNGSAPYPEIISSWVPFDKSRGFGYGIVILLQIMGILYGSLTVASYDTNAVVIMIFFAGQLEILRENCKNLFANKKDVLRKFRDCHMHHVNLMRYATVFDSVLSPIMFLYVIICSLMICSSAVQMTKEGVTTVQEIWIAEYIGALITQLFLYCWHSNQVYSMSLTVSDGVYGSDWWSVDARERRNVILLAAQLNKTVMFNAGPFTTLSVATFITIIKGAYSFYTLITR
ncbi:odorant receptor 4-like [Leptidea sinapis]|uniref:odorant receptor 4-like n=1 Tax=Leptidea sinapis TaxID=189913 RepID=UPI0021C4A59A|nr:odorant receptor 4-like [Leptidea sinapis]